MSPEVYYLRFVQIVVSINTVLFFIGVRAVLKGNLVLHKRLNFIAASTTLLGVVGLVVTVFMGFDYAPLTTPTRMFIHRCFSTPLLPILITVLWTGLANKKDVHKLAAKIMIPFWLGTLITGWWYF
jgi:uncharacterized membrane protein YozB (DUF420 family)